MDIAIQLKKRNLEMIDHRQHVLGGTSVSYTHLTLPTTERV